MMKTPLSLDGGTVIDQDGAVMHMAAPVKPQLKPAPPPRAGGAPKVSLSLQYGDPQGASINPRPPRVQHAQPATLPHQPNQISAAEVQASARTALLALSEEASSPFAVDEAVGEIPMRLGGDSSACASSIDAVHRAAYAQQELQYTQMPRDLLHALPEPPPTQNGFSDLPYGHMLSHGPSTPEGTPPHSARGVRRLAESATATPPASQAHATSIGAGAYYQAGVSCTHSRPAGSSGHPPLGGSSPRSVLQKAANDPLAGLEAAGSSAPVAS